METTPLGFSVALMPETDMRYTTLFETMAARFQADPASQATWPPQFKNLAYTLDQFRNHCKVADADDPVGPEFRDAFVDKRRSFLDKVRAKGRGDKTVRDKKHLLQKWHELHLTLLLDDEADEERAGTASFSKSLARVLKVKDVSYRELALKVGVSHTTLYTWLKGTVPFKKKSQLVIARIEAFAGLPTGMLAQMHSGKRPRIGTVSPFRKQQALMKAMPDYVHSDAEFPESLRVEFRDLVDYKTKTAKTHWSTRPAEEMQQQTISWASTLKSEGGKLLVCSTALINWGGLRSYLSYLTLPKAPEEDSDVILMLDEIPESPQQLYGPGYPIEELSLAHLVKDPTLFGRYVRFVAERAGAINQGPETVAGFLANITKPKTGYLQNRPALAEKIGLKTAADWAEKCTAAHDHFLTLKNGVIKEDGEHSRDPFAEIDHIINSPDPLAYVKECVARMKADVDRAEPGSMNQAVLGRNCALAALLINNPLRARQQAAMTWYKDGSGNLKQTSPGNYVVAFNARTFKNYRGSKKEPYVAEFSGWAAGPVHDYLTNYRPILLAIRDEQGNIVKDKDGEPVLAKSDRVFVSSRQDKPRVRPWGGLNRCVRQFTRAYFGNHFGPHYFRDISATMFLKRDPRAFLLVSTILHDTLPTVMKHYARFGVRDGFKVLKTMLDE